MDKANALPTVPQGEQKQKKRTFDVLPKPDKLIRYHDYHTLDCHTQPLLAPFLAQRGYRVWTKGTARKRSFDGAAKEDILVDFCALRGYRRRSSTNFPRRQHGELATCPIGASNP